MLNELKLYGEIEYKKYNFFMLDDEICEITKDEEYITTLNSQLEILEFIMEV